MKQASSREEAIRRARRPARAGLGRLVLLVVAIVLLVLVGCGDRRETPINKAMIAADAPDEESWSATIIFADSSWTKARLQVGHARKYYQRAETLLDSGVYVEFYASDGTLNATLVADSARVDDRTSDMIAYGAVHIESNGGARIVDTDKLNYDHEGARVHSPARVSIVDNVKGQILHGVGFTSNLSLTKYEIYRPTGTVKVQQ
jgi:LPS export ABC transporter protein LptC